MPTTKKNSKKLTSKTKRSTKAAKAARTNSRTKTAEVKVATPSNNRSTLPSFDKNRAYFLIIALIVALFGIIMLVPRQANLSATESALQHTITYQGQDGKTALELLKNSHQVSAQEFSIGSYVTAIDGVEAPTNYFWSLSVNGNPSEVGADQYVTKNSDTLTWHLERIQ